jgi:hypothetical protein
VTPAPHSSQWNMLHYVVAGYESGAEAEAAACLAYYMITEPGKTDSFHDMIRRLFLASDQKWPQTAHLYARIGASWPEIERIANRVVARLATGEEVP